MKNYLIAISIAAGLWCGCIFGEVIQPQKPLVVVSGNFHINSSYPAHFKKRVGLLVGQLRYLLKDHSKDASNAGISAAYAKKIFLQVQLVIEELDERGFYSSELSNRAQIERCPHCVKVTKEDVLFIAQKLTSQANNFASSQ